MRVILLFALIICLIFAQWVGVPVSWLLSIVAGNNYGAILLLFCLIYLIFEVIGFNKRPLSSMHLPQLKKNSKDKVGQK